MAPFGRCQRRQPLPPVSKSTASAMSWEDRRPRGGLPSHCHSVVRVGAGGDAAGTMAPPEDGKVGVARPGDQDSAAQVGHVVGDVLDVEALALGKAAAAQVEGVGGHAARGGLPSGPGLLAARLVDSVADHDDGQGLALRCPRAHVVSPTIRTPATCVTEVRVWLRGQDPTEA